jgi:hypothetical protein
MSQGPAAFGAAGAGACGADSLPPLIELKMAPTAWLATAEPAPKAIPAEEWIVGINFRRILIFKMRIRDVSVNLLPEAIVDPKLASIPPPAG